MASSFPAPSPQQHPVVEGGVVREGAFRAGARGVVDQQPWRLRKHADYQRVYKASRKQFSASLTWFAAVRADAGASSVARVGLTVGKVLGGAVERNRIKRRMRAAVRMHVGLLPAGVDVVLHPRKTVMDMEFAVLQREVERVFGKIAG